MVSLLSIGNKLSFPVGRRPGFNPSHFAAKKCTFSVVSVGANATNLCNPSAIGIPLVTAPTKVIDGALGVTSSFPGTFQNGIGFNNLYPAVVQNNITMALIARVFDNSISGATSHLYMSSGNSQSAGWWWGTATSLQGMFVAGPFSSNIVTTPSYFPQMNVPYFFAVSISNAGTNLWNVNFVARRLDTGQLELAQTVLGGGTTAAASDGGGTFAGSNWINDIQGNGAAGMVALQTLTLPQLILWSEDPWAFWYPQTLDITNLLRAPVVAAGPALLAQKVIGPPMGRMARYHNLLNAPAPITVAAPTVTGGTLPFMGVG
jgi:hypothetical protein